MENKKQIAIFVCYHTKSEIFANEIYKPIQTGCALNEEMEGFLHDNTGNNISLKNPNYGELTAVYWVWKNYLKENPNTDYIGFCHYRRFFDFVDKKENFSCFELEDYNIFKNKIWPNNTPDKIEEYIKDYDVIVPAAKTFDNESVIGQFLEAHPKIHIVMNKFIEIVKRDYPDYVKDMEDILYNNKLYICLNYVMKRELFNAWCKWLFDILFKIEPELDYSQYKDYGSVRAPAYVAERFLSVWLKHQAENKNIKIKEKPNYILDNFNPKMSGKMIKYKHKTIINLFGIKVLKYKFKIIINLFGIKITISNKKQMQKK